MAIEIFDNEGKLRSISRVLTASVCDKLDGTLTFDFTVLQEGQQPILPGMTAKYGGQVYDIVRVMRGFSSGLEISEVSCEHISYTLNDKQYNLVTFVFEGTPIEGLTQLLAGTPFTVGIVEPSTMVECAFTDESPLNRRSALMKFADACGGEIEYDGYAINIRIHRGKSERVELMDGTNVTGLSATYDSRKNIQSYEIQFYKWVPISVGDEVHIRYRPLSINVNTRIVGLTYNPFDRYSVRVEVGDYVPNLLAAETERLAAIKQEFRAANGKLESKIESVDGSLSELNQTVSGFDTRISSAEGSVSSLSQTVSGFDTRISGAEGSVSSLSQTVSGFDTRISSAEGSVSSLSQTVSGFDTRISSTEGSVSSLSQSINNIKSSVVTTDDTGNFIGTQIEQTPEWVRIAWNKYTDAVQFQNGGLYILDKTGKVLAILDGNGIVAEKGIFKGKVQSGDISKYGVEISDGTLKGYRNNELVAYVSTNSDMVVDDTVNPGMRIAAKGGIVLRSPYLAVAKDYLAPNSNGEMLLGGNGSFNAVTSFETTGEGEDRKLVFNYKNLSFTNGIMTSNLQGGSNIVDYPEQPVNPPQADNTYQEEIEESYPDIMEELTTAGMTELTRKACNNLSYYEPNETSTGTTTKSHKGGIWTLSTDNSMRPVSYCEVITAAQIVNTLGPMGFDCNEHNQGVPNDNRWYGSKPIAEAGLTRNFLWPLREPNDFYVFNFDCIIYFFVVGYAGNSWYVSSIIGAAASVMQPYTVMISNEEKIVNTNWYNGSRLNHSKNPVKIYYSGIGRSAKNITSLWLTASNYEKSFPNLFNGIRTHIGNDQLSSDYITDRIFSANSLHTVPQGGSNTAAFLCNAPLGIQIFNIDGVPHITFGTSWAKDGRCFFYDNLFANELNASASQVVVRGNPIPLSITRLSSNLKNARIYATYESSNATFYHKGLSRLESMRSEFLGLG